MFSASINEPTGVLTAENKIIYLCYYLFPSITYIKRKNPHVIEMPLTSTFSPRVLSTITSLAQTMISAGNKSL